MEFQFPPIYHAIPSVLAVACGVLGMYFLRTMGVIVGLPVGFFIGAGIVWSIDLREK